MTRVLSLAAMLLLITTAASAQYHSGNPDAKQPTAAQLDPQVKKLEGEAAKLEKQLKSKPHDTKIKLATAEAWYKAGYASEYSKRSLPARTRYRTALKHYRRCLALNPNHSKAKKEKAQIEAIYRTMPGGIPKDT